jgi:arylsulfatase A-like enzyme
MRKSNPRLGETAIAGGPSGDPMRGVTERAIDFLDASASEPFFLFASYLYPHTPYHLTNPQFDRWASRQIPRPAIEPEGLSAAGKPFRHQFHQRNNDAILPFSEAQTTRMRQVYHGMIEFVDAEIGALLRHLSDRRIAENTLVVFTSDHGDYMGDHGLYTKSPSMYDCLTRVPLIVRWPERIRRPRRDSAFVSHVDLMPVFAAAAGIEPPRQAQGRNFLAEGFRRDAAFSEYGVPGTPYTHAKLRAEGLENKRFSNPGEAALPWEGNPVSLAGRFRMVRTQKWKYVNEPGGTDELYDLEHDPNELTNLAGDRAQRSTIRDMQAKLARLITEAQPS